MTALACGRLPDRDCGKRLRRTAVHDKGLTMITVTTRRTLGSGPEAPAQSIRAAEADLLDALPGIRLPDMGDLRARGVLGSQPAASPGPRRALGTGRTDEAAAESPA
ncbi:hypothetical protein GCM10010377_71410 [Streptomyces viridiviolaceus]|nr:hypothetical protein GCM10010377_71410 [Streptomyces viridiviolaceus]